MHIISPNKVFVSRDDVATFNAQWPCSELRSSRAYWFEFDESGDLVDTDCPESDDGAAALAMTEDCKAWLQGAPLPSWGTAQPMVYRWRLKAFTHEIVDLGGVVWARLRVGKLNGLAIDVRDSGEIARSGGPSIHDAVAMALYLKDSIPAERIETPLHYLTAREFPGCVVRPRQ